MKGEGKCGGAALVSVALLVIVIVLLSIQLYSQSSYKYLSASNPPEASIVDYPDFETPIEDIPGTTVPQTGYSPLTDNINHVYPYPMFDGIGWSIASGGVPQPPELGRWTKVGIVSSQDGNGVVFDLYQKAIYVDAYEYYIRDKHDFTIPLTSPRGRYTFLEDGDVIPSIVGYEKYAPFRVTMYPTPLVLVRD